MAESIQDLWNCSACGTKRLVVAAHTFCPNCGCVQKQEDRYAQKAAEAIPLNQHIYIGSGQICPYCSSANSEAAKHCVACGVGLTNATLPDPDVSHVSGFSSMHSDVSRKMLSEYTQYRQVKPGNFFWFKGLPTALKAFFIVFVIGFSVAVYGLLNQYWQDQVAVTVVGHSWTRSIDVERYSTFYESRWCSDMPSGAREIQVSSQVKDYEPGACDRSDPNCKEKPIYADHCSYAVDRWGHHITMVESGDKKSDTPIWPELGALNECESKVGCERVAGKSERYTVHFRADEDSEDEVYTCDFSQQHWSNVNLAEHYQGPRGMLYGALDCQSLTKISNGPPPVTVAH